VEYLIVKNWGDFQHYKQRNPPWIKLYTRLTDDYEFSSLADASKLLAVYLWMFAAKHGNKIPCDREWLRRVLPLKWTDENLKSLIQHGFIECTGDASIMLAPCKQSAMPRRDREETETETETETEEPSVERKAARPNGKETEEVFAYWQTELNHPHAQLDAKREKVIKARFKEGYTVDRIKQAIRGIKKCPHNMGQNDRNQRYDDIELICRSGANVDRFADAETAKPRFVGQERYENALLTGGPDDTF
jgi:hypothetical protein